MNALHFAGSDFYLEASDLSPDLAEALTDCGRPGPADSAVAFVRSNWSVTGNPSECRDYLAGYGAWDDDELSDHEHNLDRLVWLTGGALAEGEAAYFSSY